MSAEESKVGSEEMRDVDQTRRALIKAGWVIPVVLAVQLPTPTVAFASTTGNPGGPGTPGVPGIPGIPGVPGIPGIPGGLLP